MGKNQEPGSGWRSTYLHEVLEFTTLEKLRTDCATMGADGWQCTGIAVDPTGQGFAVFTKHKWLIPDTREEREKLPEPEHLTRLT